MKSYPCGESRPCACDRYRPGERYTVDQCRDCYLFHCNPIYRARWSPCGGPPPDPAETGALLARIAEAERPAAEEPTRRRRNSRPVPANTPCEHRSERIPPEKASRLGLGTVREYYRCAAGQTLNRAGVVGVVCPCAGCGPSCRRYSPGEES